VRFIRDLLEDLEGMLAVDPDRIYVNGMSNGGAMTHRLACEMADVFAAAGVVAGPIVDLPEGCAPARPIPILGFYGTADPLVDYEGGTLSAGTARRMFHREQGLRMDSAQEWVAAWGERNGCAAHQEAAGPGAEIRSDTYSACREGADVVLYTIEGGGHTWPGGPDFPFLGATTRSVSASEVMLEFFLGHSLQGEG
jgi:polyhydroxybutyrate depolymerase